MEVKLQITTRQTGEISWFNLQLTRLIHTSLHWRNQLKHLHHRSTSRSLTRRLLFLKSCRAELQKHLINASSNLIWSLSGLSGSRSAAIFAISWNQIYLQRAKGLWHSTSFTKCTTLKTLKSLHLNPLYFLRLIIALRYFRQDQRVLKHLKGEPNTNFWQILSSVHQR